MAKIITETTMNMQHFHDFYFMEAMTAGATAAISANPELEFSKPVDKFLTDLENTKEKLVENMALRTFMYLYAACLGEARHATDTVAKERFLKNGTRRGGRKDWFANVVQYKPTKDNLNILVDIFSQEWRAGYGGSAWLNIAQALKDYKTMDKSAWLDHVVDLEHNNGTAFSKPEGKKTIMFDVYYPDRFSAFLDYKFQEDVLKKAPNFCFYLSISPRVDALLSRYANIFKTAEVKWVKPELENLGPYSVEWGNKLLEVGQKWSTWASVSSSGGPSARTLLNSHGLGDIYATSYTRKQLKAKCQRVVRHAINSLLADFATPEFVASIKESAKHYYDNNKTSCKLPPAKTTYGVLPCFVKCDKMTHKIYVDAPYQRGYGTPVEDGTFCIETTVYGLNSGGTGYIVKRFGDVSLQLEGNKYWIENAVLEALLD